MKLKKTNAALGVLSGLLLLIHVGYTIFCYLTFYYNPVYKLWTAVPFITAACLHAVCGMSVLFLQADGTRADLYPKINRQTVLQRLSAVLIFPLLILHINTYHFLQTAAAAGRWAVFALLLASQVLFYGTVMMHTALSFSRALITFGLLSSAEGRKTADRVVCVLGALVFLLAVYAVIKGEIAMIPMFLSQGGGA